MSPLQTTLHTLFGVQLAAAALLLLAAFVTKSARCGRSALFRGELELVSAAMFFLFVALAWYGHFFAPGRTLVSPILAPGSLLTRSLVVDAPLWLRRFAEPAVWFLMLLVVVAAHDARNARACRLYNFSAVSFFLSLLSESGWLALGRSGGRPEAAVSILGAAFVQAALAFLIAALLFDIFGSEADRKAGFTRTAVTLPCAFAAAGLIVLLLISSLAASRAPLMVGAHYYSWFPENWKAGYIGERLVPPVHPELGQYRSDDPDVFPKHAAWAKEAGINFFVIDWWSKRPAVRRRIDKMLERYPDLLGLSFAMMYESSDLKDEGDESFAGEETNVVFMTKARSKRLASHWAYLARTFMSHPRYLKIGGRPVLFIYASRHLVGPVAAAVDAARNEVRASTGIDLHLVGDEVYFNVLTYSQRYGLLLRRERSPEWERLSAFDAITVYNPYDGARTEHAGGGGGARFIADVEDLYRSYRGVASAAGIQFVPGWLPGYNDRGVRLAEDHFVIPRVMPDGRSLFSEGLVRVVLPFLDRNMPMLTVTSWNEWNEGTQIEPARESPETASDSSESGQDYTQGAHYFGYGSGHLYELAQIIKDYAEPSDSRARLRFKQ